MCNKNRGNSRGHLRGHLGRLDLHDFLNTKKVVFLPLWILGLHSDLLSTTYHMSNNAAWGCHPSESLQKYLNLRQNGGSRVRIPAKAPKLKDENFSILGDASFSHKKFIPDKKGARSSASISRVCPGRVGADPGTHPQQNPNPNSALNSSSSYQAL